jgi:hypothetical protein
MKRPVIKEAKAADYADYLEALIREFSSETTKVQSYKALKSFVESNCKLLKNMDLSDADMASKDDKKIERALKFANELLVYNDTLDKLFEKVAPIMSSERGEKEAASISEEALKIAMNGKG